MTQTPHDQLAQKYLEEFLSPFGLVQRQYEVPGEAAIREILALSVDHPRRNMIVRLLALWRVRIDVGELADFTDREELMALSEAFLAWEEQKEMQSREAERQSIALNMLQDNLPLETIARFTRLSIEQIQALQNQMD